MLSGELEKSVCFSCWDRKSAPYVKTIMTNIIIVTVLTLIWIIFSFAFRPPKFDDGVMSAMSVFRILSLIIQVVTLFYTIYVFNKYRSEEDPEQDYVKTWAKVELGLLCAQFLFLVINFILSFLMIVNFIEGYKYNHDSAFFAVSRSIMIVCLLATTWEIYMLFMVFMEGDEPYQPSSKKKVVKKVKEQPVYTENPTNFQNEPEDGFEDDFMQVNPQTGYIDQSVTEKDSHRGENIEMKPISKENPSSMGDGNEDDFIGMNYEKGSKQGYYLNESEDSRGLNDNQPQYYINNDGNDPVDLNKKEGGNNNDAM